jgi:hypothetical protein
MFTGTPGTARVYAGRRTAAALFEMAHVGLGSLISSNRRFSVARTMRGIRLAAR